ncbi:hypothetical protein TNCV_1893471, partial [Trichonephila clavipes]
RYGIPRLETAHSTACLGPVRKALFLIRVLDSWSASRGQHSQDSPLRFLKRPALVFSRALFPRPLLSRSPPLFLFRVSSSPQRALLNTRGVFTARPSLLLIRRSQSASWPPPSSYWRITAKTPDRGPRRHRVSHPHLDAINAKTHQSVWLSAIVPCPHLDTLVHHATCF